MVLIVALLGTPAGANTLCDDLNALGDAGTLALPQGEATCRASLAMSGARHLHCSLEFAYRAPAATAAFDALSDALAACLGPDATMVSDMSVNHPDAYDLRVFTARGREYGVSIKDKGALQQTLVFVRVQTNP